MTKKEQIINFVEHNPLCTTKTIQNKFHCSGMALSIICGYLLKPTKTDLRHLKPLSINGRRHWVVSTEPIKTIKLTVKYPIGVHCNQVYKVQFILDYINLNNSNYYKQFLKPYCK